MDCEEAEGQLLPYLLGSLASEEVALLDCHLDTCSQCRSRLRQDSDLVAGLAYAVPQLSAPPSIKHRLFSRIGREADIDRPTSDVRRRSWILSDLGSRLAARSGLAVTAVLIAVIVLGGVWFNNRLNNIATEKEALASELETMTEGKAEMVRKLREQRDLTYMLTEPDVSVKALSGTTLPAGAAGKIFVSATGEKVLVTAQNLPPLPEDKVYRVWLVKADQRYSVGSFAVDSTGWGQADLELSAPLSQFTAIIITIGIADGRPDPMEDSVLRGDL